ncbi:hypothetical protein [Burkholderia lata]|uniref:hypothetical protein n=1 Tax=Burkholderia lata (strain ATCC 17760 / DSM 23089 / LMG 22485 / NCIMB 9086 / R18194 / 383) TaxID=482957 RepID=UPI001581E436|nr:hypothetical protein [Burkholderia lata]
MVVIVVISVDMANLMPRANPGMAVAEIPASSSFAGGVVMKDSARSPPDSHEEGPPHDPRERGSI